VFLAKARDSVKGDGMVGVNGPLLDAALHDEDMLREDAIDDSDDEREVRGEGERVSDRAERDWGGREGGI